jgi:hypothetical protein
MCTLSGTIRAPDARPSELEQHILPLELLAGISGEILSTIDTTDRGEFDFGNLPPGIYFIHLKRFTAFFGDVEGLISVAVDPTAPARADKLDLNLTWTSCGLMYMDQSKCPQLDLYVKKLQGHMSRSPRVEIVLRDAAQNLIAHVNTDPDGNFSFPGPLAGTFDLRIDGGAITPVHTQLHIDPTAPGSSLEIQRGSLTSCTAVRVQ